MRSAATCGISGAIFSAASRRNAQRRAAGDLR
eukprot:CAMPEP_0197130922 /NCGR_PEP_ID=MMETSP1390-20130617/20537_1 /TAXON_ID=38833 /ORGANISM="Micromonas sp., Strain CCMP2099" /LENGTH=31 /DNA_ID= /DNA_START= /DNA_END= /DNA_ORIENTATION=